MQERLWRWAREVRGNVVALGHCARDPRTPLAARIVAGLVLAYALSPIDLIPDFVPVLGYLDDAIIVPLGVLLAIRLIPPELFREHRERAEAAPAGRAKWLGAAIVVAVWIGLSALVLRLFGLSP